MRFPENQAIRPGDYYFCPAKACTVGYFSTEGSMIPKQQLGTAGNIQEAMLCYCFDISEAHYRLALQTDKAEPVKQFVIAQTCQAPGDHIQPLKKHILTN